MSKQLENPLKDPAWVTLKGHWDDKTLTTINGTNTWEIEPEFRKSYRIFRVIQIDANDSSSNESWKDVFAVASFEVFGTLVETVETQGTVATTTEKEKAAKLISKTKLENEVYNVNTLIIMCLYVSSLMSLKLQRSLDCMNIGFVVYKYMITN